MLDRDISEAEAEPSRNRRRAFPTSLSRYDLTLLFIPSAFLVAMLVGRLFAFSARTALVAGAAVGALALVDGLFLNPPQSGRRP